MKTGRPITNQSNEAKRASYHANKDKTKLAEERHNEIINKIAEYYHKSKEDAKAIFQTLGDADKEILVTLNRLETKIDIAIAKKEGN